MEHNYLGETHVTDLKGTPYEGFGPTEWALEYVSHYGQIDGGHHKQWVLDQVARILLGTPVEVVLAKWDNGEEEYRFTTGEPSDKYVGWVLTMLGEFDPANGEYEYSYDEGIAP